MGRSNSKEKAPNNPWDSQILKAKKREKLAKKLLREKKLQEKRDSKKKKKSKLDDCNEPIPPHVFRKSPLKFEESDYDAEAKRRMQNQLACDSEIFVLNQMMLGIQFYGNYEREMWEAVERNRKQENFQTTKISAHCKTVILPDRLLDAVDKRVKFNTKHGPFKNQTQPLHTQTLYVVHDNIELTNPGETSVYSILTDAPIYKLEIEDSMEEKNKNRAHYGYVKLKSVEFIRKAYSNSDYGGSQSIYNKSLGDENGEEDAGPSMVNFDSHKFSDSIASSVKTQQLQESDTQIYKNGVSQSNVSTSSTSPQSSEYDYAYITALHTHQPLRMVMRSINNSEEPLSTVVLPDACITTINCSSEMNEGYYSDDESDAEKDNKKRQTREYTNEAKQYLNSKGFLAYFINMFQETLAENLGIDSEELMNATWKGAVIYSGKWEIMPAISCPWPREASEWVYRLREVKENPVNGQKFQWPTPPMVSKVRGFGCHVTPIGYAPKIGNNKYRQLEWKIVFPEAERYLESCLTNTQAKIYMMTKALIKTFVDPNLNAGLNMFSNEHIRTHLFWQCESNYAAWPEDYLGEALIRFLNALLDRIKTHRLPDYFIPNRNLFENIPEKILVELHKRIFRITENPVMHLLIAMRNLKFPSTRIMFYPKLKIKRLYSILIIDNPLKIINPKFRDDHTNLAAEDSDEEGAIERETAFGSMAYFNKQELESRKKRTRVVRLMEAERNRKDLQLNDCKRASIDSIDTKFVPLKHMENLRRQLMYNVFIKQFMGMANVSYKYRSCNQGLIYLKQAERLCSLLIDDQGVEEAHSYLVKINKLQKEITETLNNSSIGPALPRRESIMEQPKKLRVRIKTPPKTSLKEEIDPYTNIDIINTHTPPKKNGKEQDNSSSSEDDFEEKHFVTNPQIHSSAVGKMNKDVRLKDMSKLLGNVAVK